MPLNDICELPVASACLEPAHLYLWVPNALLPEGLKVMSAWGFHYKSNIISGKDPKRWWSRWSQRRVSPQHH